MKRTEKQIQTARKLDLDPLAYLLDEDNLRLERPHIDLSLELITEAWLKPRAAEGAQAVLLALKLKKTKILQNLAVLPCVREALKDLIDIQLVRAIISLNNLPTIMAFAPILQFREIMDSHLDELFEADSDCNLETLDYILNIPSTAKRTEASLNKILMKLIDRGELDFIQRNVGHFTNVDNQRDRNPLEHAISTDKMNVATFFIKSGLTLVDIDPEMAAKYRLWLIKQNKINPVDLCKAQELLRKNIRMPSGIYRIAPVADNRALAKSGKNSVLNTVPSKIDTYASVTRNTI